MIEFKCYKYYRFKHLSFYKYITLLNLIIAFDGMINPNFYKIFIKSRDNNVYQFNCIVNISKRFLNYFLLFRPFPKY